VSLLPILYRDDHLCAIDKPAWSVVHSSRGAEGAMILVRALAAQLGAPVFPVHRLDRQTSGVLLFALSAEAAGALGVELREGRMQKSYLGLCRGVIAEPLTVDHPVPEDAARRPAVTEIDPLEILCARYTFLRARPRTGRRHQLRYHLKHLEHPLVGDTNYGKGPINRFFRERFGLQRLFLHAERLRVLHPFEARMLELEAPLPEELARVLEALRGYDGPVA
jgi:tRNA pseudouridine65 synthase